MNKFLIIVSILAFSTSVLAAEGGGGDHGSFEGRVVVEWLDDPFVPTMRLVEPFAYEHSKGKVWKVPQGHVIKDRGMPPLFSDLIGQPFYGGTYWPPTQRMGMPGFPQVLDGVIEAWRQRDPIIRLKAELIAQGILNDEGWQQMEREIRAAIEAAVKFAAESPFPEPEAALEDVFAD